MEETEPLNRAAGDIWRTSLPYAPSIIAILVIIVVVVIFLMTHPRILYGLEWCVCIGALILAILIIITITFMV